MTGVLVLPGTAPEADWIAARALGISASRVAALMGLSNWSSPYKLYHQMRGDLPWEEDNDAMALGRYLEDYVVQRFADRYPEFLLAGDGRALYAHLGRPWQLATPDRLVSESYEAACGPSYGVTEAERLIAVLETKTDNSHDGWGDDGTDEIPVRYRCQVLWQCDVLGVDHWYLACLFLHSRQIRVYEGMIDGQARADLDLMRLEALEFLARVQLGDPPDVDWRPATTDALKALHPSVTDVDVPIGKQLTRSYRAAVRRYDEAEQRKQLMTNRVLEVIGDGHRAVADGVYVRDRAGRMVPDRVATRSVYDQRRIDSQMVRALYPAVAAECLKVSTVAKLVPAKPKEQPA
jgi:putative phage-type endonuclease